MIVASAVALGIGLWPVQANVFGDASYACGSGFIHSTRDWKVDSSALQFQRLDNGTATGLPAGICPDKVDSRRDLALLVMAFGLAIGLLFMLFLDRKPARNFGSTMFANRRRGAARAPMPVRRAPSDKTSTP